MGEKQCCAHIRSPRGFLCAYRYEGSEGFQRSISPEALLKGLLRQKDIESAIRASSAFCAKASSLQAMQCLGACQNELNKTPHRASIERGLLGPGKADTPWRNDAGRAVAERASMKDRSSRSRRAQETAQRCRKRGLAEPHGALREQAGHASAWRLWAAGDRFLRFKAFAF